MNKTDIKRVIDKIEPGKGMEYRLAEKMLKKQRNKFVLKPIVLLAGSLVMVVCLGIVGHNFAERGPNTSSFEGSYPAALMWNSAIYVPSTSKEINQQSIDNEIGTITKQVNPMPKENGEINDISDFSPGSQLFAIKDVEVTEAIAAMAGGKYYRLDRIRSSLGVVWDNKVYDFIGNFDVDTVDQGKIDKSIGEVKRTGVKESFQNGDIIALGDETDKSIFPLGSKICLLKDEGPDKAIAVEDKNGRFQKAVYIKKNLNNILP